jgi:N-terminal domain with HPIH motif
MLSPLVAVASRAALYPIQSIILIALLVSGAYFHLLDIARNAPASSIPSGDVYSSTTSFPPTESTIWARKNTNGWKWTLDPVSDIDGDVWTLLLIILIKLGQTSSSDMGTNRNYRGRNRTRFSGFYTHLTVHN